MILSSLNKLVHRIPSYPDDNATELKKLLSESYDVKVENLIIGCGSDEIIDFCIRAKCHYGSKILTASVTFGMYGIYAHQVGAKVLKTISQTHQLDEFLEIYRKEKPDIIFLCLPNNPLGECLDFSEVIAFLKEIDSNTLVVLDGAYQEFARVKDPKKAVNMSVIKDFDNVIYLGTFSKAYGLAGLRVGYGISQKQIIQALSKIRSPYNVSSLSVACAAIAFKDKRFLQESVQNTLDSMQSYENFFKQENIKFIPSYANFVTFFCRENVDCSVVVDKMQRNGVLLKNLKSYGLNAIRLTIGTEIQNKKVFGLLKEKIY